MRVNNSSDILIKGNEFRQNVDGVDCQAGCVGNTIKENGYRDNSARGIMLRGFSIDNVVKENTLTGNRVGILLFGATDSTVKENIVSASLFAGIRITVGGPQNVVTTGNLIKENTVSSNPAGIEFLLTPTGSATGNAVVENAIATNTCGLKGPLAGNIVSENLFGANVVDICP
jgi:parallel beta-helix repeat protein